MIRLINKAFCRTNTALFNKNNLFFSDFFRERDRAEFREIELRKDHDFRYLKIKDQIENIKQKKIRIRLRKERISAEKEKIEENKQKLVIHNPSQGIIYPLNDMNGIFAVINVNNFQYKVVENDVLAISKLKNLDINQHIIFDQVLLVGTKDYTALGRPLVETAKVYATIEQQTKSEKVIVFKKRRRKNYKKNAGSTAELTVLRINKIEHLIDQQLISTAVSLV